jgi:molecular chaperone GrpE
MEQKDSLPENETMDINSDSDVPGNTHLSNPVEEGLPDKLQKELEEQKDKYLRLVAEFDNFKRRNAKERNEMIMTAGKEVITSLLEVLDDSERAEKQLEESQDLELNKAGIKLVFAKLRNTLQARGLKKMDSIHNEFDVEKHEAITEVPAGEELAGKVVDEIEKGYYLNDKIIRFAKVVVGK